MNLNPAASVSDSVPLSRPEGRDAARPSPWVWMVVACVVLGASGVVRSWQDRRFDAEAESGAIAPFPLNELPTVLKGWRVREGFERRLDPRIVRIAGCSDYVTRTYVDERTGVAMTVLVAFGPAELVAASTPDICFPSSGYKLVEAPSDHEIAMDRGPARFRSEVFAKGEGGSVGREEVYYSFRLQGRWTPDAAGRREEVYRRYRSLFKVQIERRVAPCEQRGPDDPCEQFLAALLPEMESRLSTGRGS